MITKLVAPWFGWQDRRPPAARGWPHLCRPPTRGEASHPPRSTLLFANLASEWQPRLDFANIFFVFPLYLQAILLLFGKPLASDQHLDIANIFNFCCIWTCSPTPGKLDLWQMTTFDLQVLLLYLCSICICIKLAALLVTIALGVCECKLFVFYLYFYQPAALLPLAGLASDHRPQLVSQKLFLFCYYCIRI